MDRLTLKMKAKGTQNTSKRGMMYFNQGLEKWGRDEEFNMHIK